jgi:ribose/xylose/arabinose/galactoside ABC-type transport system permease subunit
MRGGRGFILGTVYGMLIIAGMNNLLNLFGVPPFLCEAFKGLIVIVAVLLQKKEKNFINVNALQRVLQGYFYVCLLFYEK